MNHNISHRKSNRVMIKAVINDQIKIAFVLALSVFLSLCFPNLGLAQTPPINDNTIRPDDGKSRYAASFLDIPLGARALALGGQFSPIDNSDGSAFYWNPSAIAMTKGQFISSTYSNQFGTLGDPLSHYFHVGYSQLLKNGAAFSVNWIRNSISNIPYTTEPRAPGNTFGPSEFQLIASGALDSGSFSNASDAVYLTIGKNIIDGLNFGWRYFSLPLELPIGVSFKYIREGFGGDGPASQASANGVGVDLGTMVRFKLGDFVGVNFLGPVAIGLNIRDLFNTPVSWNVNEKIKSAIPRSVLFNVSYQQPLPFFSSTILFLAAQDTKYDKITSLGVEYRFKQVIAFRLGSYGNQVTLGAGLLVLKAFFIDYAYQSSELGVPHRISLTVNLQEL
jgi:hypothetical protein